MTKKIILFGLIANISMLFKNKIWKDVILIVDNNPRCHGQHVNGVLVVGPDAISGKVYDEILILTWAYSQIRRQLIALNVPSDRIFAVNKRLVTTSVFEQRNIREVALRFVSDLCVYSKDLGVNLYVDAGTLLGIARNKHLVPWDTDIDFSILVKDFKKTLDYVTIFAKEKNKDYKVVLNSLDPGAVTIDGKLIIEDTIVPFDIFTRSILGKYSLSESGEHFSCNARHFIGVDTIEFDSYFFTVPVDFCEYLSSLYGGDWRMPKKNFSYADFNYNFY